MSTRARARKTATEPALSLPPTSQKPATTNTTATPANRTDMELVRDRFVEAYVACVSRKNTVLSAKGDLARRREMDQMIIDLVSSLLVIQRSHTNHFCHYV